MRPYEIIEHTAEIGVRAYGGNLEELFAHMAQGMFSLIVPPEEVQPQTSFTLKVNSDSLDRLMVAWLRELLFLFDTKRFLGRIFQVRFTDSLSLEATVSGEDLEFERHHVDKEVKAVTYCDLSVTQNPDGTWVSQVIFDI